MNMEEDGLVVTLTSPNEENFNNERKEIDDDIKIREKELLYSLEDFPPWHISAFLGLQHFLTMIGPAVTLVFIMASALCVGENDPARGRILSTMFLVEGVVTFIQVTMGIRLPIVQGATASFLAPTLTILSLNHNKCPANFDIHFWDKDMSAVEKTQEWQRRMREIQGCIILASTAQLLLGLSGVVGLVLKFITPLTIAPAISVMGLSLIPVATNYCSQNWFISLLTVILIIGFSQYLSKKEIYFGCKSNGSNPIRVPIFKLFPILLAIVSVWLLCLVLTLTGFLDENNSARTDLKMEQISQANWLHLPYPFQWGWPTFTVAGTVGMLMGVITSSIESIGDYYACARLCNIPSPPMHAVNRANLIEGLGSVFAAVMGAGNGTTSYSENVAVINISRVGSRMVVLYTAFFLIVCGLSAKFGSLFLTVPDPIVGGVSCVMFSVVVAVGLSNLQWVNLNSSRNMLILGFSIFFPLMVSGYVNGKESSIATGNVVVNQILLVVLKTPMFGAGLLGLILDNSIPGNKEDRGLNSEQEEEIMVQRSPYDLPIGMNTLTKSSNISHWNRYRKWTRFLPILPTYRT